MKPAAREDYLWIASEICYYLGLVLFALGVPALSFILWVMSRVGRADPDFLYLLVAWLVNGLLLAIGIGLKRRLIR